MLHFNCGFVKALGEVCLGRTVFYPKFQGYLKGEDRVKIVAVFGVESCCGFRPKFGAV